MHVRIGRLARRGYGVVSWEQALGCGFTPRMIEGLLNSGRWTRMHRGVYRINGTPESWEGRAIAACQAAGPGATLSHRSAAAAWGLDGFGPRWTIHVTVPAQRRPRLSGVHVHRSRDLDVAKVTTRGGLPVTGLARTVLDLAATEPNREVALRALDAARRRPHHLPWRELWGCLALHSRRGRPGVSTFRELLDHRDGTEPTDDVFEALVYDLLVDAGLPPPEAQYPVGRYRLDLAYPRPRVAVECHGKDGHLNERAFEYDAVRDAVLKLDGWLILYVTWARFRDNPAGVVDDVRQALALRQAV